MKIEDILKIIKINNANTVRGEIFTEFPLIEKTNYSRFRIVYGKWYHNFWSKRKIQFLQWYRNKNNICTCECHIVPGFYHCWATQCCKEENKIFPCWYKG